MSVSIATGVTALDVLNPTTAAAVVGASGVRAVSVAGKIDAAPSLLTNGVKVLTAIAENDTGSDWANCPVGIRVYLADGWAPSDDCIRVKNSAGSYVQWQWEPARHDRTRADISTHASTNIKQGTVWVIDPLLSAAAPSTYYVEVWPTAQTQTAIPSIVLSTPSGTIDRLTHADWTADFDSAISWGLYSYVKVSTGYDFFSGSTASIGTVWKGSNADTSEYSDLQTGTKSQTSVSHGQVDASAFGAGVVFVDYECVSTPATQTNITNRQRYRMFANGTFTVEITQTATAGIASTDQKLCFSGIKLRVSCPSNVVDQAGVWAACSYGGENNILMMVQSMIHNSDADGSTASDPYPGTGSYALTGSDPRLRAGSSMTTYAVPNGMVRRQYYALAMVPDGDYAKWRTRLWNPVKTTAAQFDNEDTQRARFGVLMRNYLARYSAYSSADTSGSLAAHKMAGLVNYAYAGGLADYWREVPAALAAWLAFDSRGPADSGLGARLQAKYVANASAAGWQYVGRDVDAFMVLYREAMRRGDSSVQATLRAIILGIADHGVLTEAQNGGTGKIKVEDPDNTVANLNATAEVISALLAAIEVGVATDAHRATLARCWSALVGALEWRNWPPYLFSGGTAALSTINSQAIVYCQRVASALLRGRDTLSLDINPLYCLRANTNAAGQMADAKHSYETARRGLPNSLQMFGVLLAQYGNVSDIEHGIMILRHIEELTGANEPTPKPIDGWGSSSTRAGGDGQTAAMCGEAIRLI